MIHNYINKQLNTLHNMKNMHFGDAKMLQKRVDNCSLKNWAKKVDFFENRHF